MERIIKASSNGGDLVAGSFCVRKGTLVLTPLNPPVNGGKKAANQGNGGEEDSIPLEDAALAGMTEGPQ